MAHTQKIFNALNTFCRQYFAKKVCLQLTFESIETQFWVTKTVWQRIPSRRARHRKAPTTETVQSVALYYQLSNLALIWL